MTAPLYNNCEKPNKCNKQGNHGLWFERFFDEYDERKNWEVGTGKTQWLSTNFHNKKVGDESQLKRYSQAQMQLVEKLQGQCHVFKSSWHFVTGMGNPHPVENGFAWHRTLGVPYLTGAAVKGLVRTFIETQLDETDETNPDKKQLLLQWFGSDHKDPEKQTAESRAGELIFFDAIPIEPVTLGVDIMTPHMGKWYEKGATEQAVGTAEAVPADWHDPVPVAFLVANEISLLFSFAIRPHPPAKEAPFRQLDLTEVEQALTAVLEQMGAGGKTATGYGGMINPEKQKQREKQQKENELLANAEQIEGYLKINNRNQSLYLERSGKQLAFATGNRPTEILETLPDELVKIMKTGKGVKVKAYYAKQEILKVEPI